MSAWKEIKLSTLADFKNGLNFNNSNWGKGLKIIGVSDFKDRMFADFDTLDEINPKGVARKEDLLQTGDILFVRSNGNRQLIGRCLYLKDLPEPVSHSGFTIRLRFKDISICVPFYVYLFKSAFIRRVLSDFGGGTNINNLNQSILSNLKVPVPSTVVQKKIAAVLSAYDDLIENNKRRIALLEKMAEEIYREWFVRLRFPGYEKVKVVKGVPEGWTVEKIKNVVSRLRFGRIYRESELNDSGKVIVIDQSQAEFLGFYDGEPQHKATAEKPIILFGDHSCKMLMMTKPFSLAENVIPFVAKSDAPVYFLFHLVKGTIETTEYKRHWTELTNKDIYAPPIHLQRRFQEIVKPYYQQIELLNDAIRFATKTRDMLLPRLISGKLSVENLNIQFPPGMDL